MRPPEPLWPFRQGAGGSSSVQTARGCFPSCRGMDNAGALQAYPFLSLTAEKFLPSPSTQHQLLQMLAEFSLRSPKPIAATPWLWGFAAEAAPALSAAERALCSAPAGAGPWSGRRVLGWTLPRAAPGLQELFKAHGKVPLGERRLQHLRYHLPPLLRSLRWCEVRAALTRSNRFFLSAKPLCLFSPSL